MEQSLPESTSSPAAIGPAVSRLLNIFLVAPRAGLATDDGPPPAADSVITSGINFFGDALVTGNSACATTRRSEGQ